MPADASQLKSLANAVTLTGSAVASSSVNIDYCRQMSLYIKYAAGTGSPTLNVTIEVSPDILDTTDANSTWHAVGTWAISSGTATFTTTTLTASVTKNVVFDFVTIGQKLRIKYSEAGAPSPFGTITAGLFTRHN